MLSGKHPVLFWVFQESLVIAPSHDAARERFSDNSRGCPFSRFTKWVVRRVDVCKCFRSAYISWRFLERRETPKKLFSETSIIISYVSACFQLIWNSFDVEILVSTFFPKIAQHLVENCLLRTGLVRSHFLWEKIHDIFMTLSPLIFYEKKSNSFPRLTWEDFEVVENCQLFQRWEYKPLKFMNDADYVSEKFFSKANRCH